MLEYLCHYVGYQSMIIKLFSQTYITLDIATDYIEYIFKRENISHIKIGKNLKETAIKTFKIYLLENYLKTLNKEDSNGFLDYLDDFLHPSQHTRR